MANLVEGVVAFLLTQTSVTSLIAGGNSVQPIPAPVDVSLYPAVVFQLVSDTTNYTISNGADGVSNARILFQCLAPFGAGSYLAAHKIALAIKAAFDAYSGQLPAGGPLVYFCEVLSVSDGFQADALLSASNVHVMLHYKS